MTVKQFATQQEAYQHFVQILVQHSIFNQADVDKARDYINEAIAPSRRGEYSEDPVISAAQFIEEYVAANPADPFPGLGNNAGGGAPQGGGEQTPPGALDQQPGNLTTGGTTTKWAPVTAPSAGIKADLFLEEKVRSTLQDNLKRQASAKITKVVVAHAPIETLKNEKVVPSVSPERMEEYEKKLVDTPENKAAFKKVKDAIASGTALPVYVSDKPGRTLGYEVQYNDTVDNQTKTIKTLVQEKDLFGLLASKLALRIPTVEGSVGVEYKQLRTKEADANGASAGSKSAVPQLKFYNRTDALKDPKMYTPANVQDDGKTVKKTVPIDIQFEIKTGLKQDGSDLTRKIRVRGETEKYPLWVRANDDMRQAFGDIESSKVLGVATRADEDKIINDVSNILRAAATNTLKENNSNFNDIVRQVLEIRADDTSATGAGAAGNL